MSSLLYRCSVISNNDYRQLNLVDTVYSRRNNFGTIRTLSYGVLDELLSMYIIFRIEIFL
jgi:hypothetical protein